MSTQTLLPTRARAMRYARTGQVGLRTWIGGDEEILCFPCAGSDSLGFRPLASALGDRYQVSAVDLPGHGGAPGRPVSSFALLVRWCSSALATRGRVPIAVVGHSFGGYLAIEVVRRLIRLDARWADTRVVVCSSLPPGAASRALSPAQPDDELIAQLVGLGGIPPQIAQSPLMEQYLPRIRADLTAAREYVRSARTSVPLANRALVVTGAQDPICRPDTAIWWRHVLPLATTVTLDAGHYIPQSAPAALASAIGTGGSQR